MASPSSGNCRTGRCWSSRRPSTAFSSSAAGSGHVDTDTARSNGYSAAPPTGAERRGRPDEKGTGDSSHRRRTQRSTLPTVLDVASIKRSRLDRILSAVVCAVSLFLFIMAWSTVDATYTVWAGVRPVIAALAALPLVAIRSNPLLGWAISAVSALVVPLVYPPADSTFPW